MFMNDAEIWAKFNQLANNILYCYLKTASLWSAVTNDDATVNNNLDML